MKLIIAIALLCKLALAKYSPGSACNTNIECNENCIDSQWTLSEQSGTYAFVCDPSVADPAQYFKADCQKAAPIIGALLFEYDAETTRVACDKVGGRNCRRGCVITGSTSTADQARDSWGSACADAGASKSGFNIRDTEGRAESLAECGSSEA